MRHMIVRRWLAAIVACALIACLALLAQAIEVAGELYVDLDAVTLKKGDTTWTNTAASDTDFIAEGTPIVTLDPIPAVYFDGRSAFAARRCAGWTDRPRRHSLHRSLGLWNPEIASEETLVAWGRRGGGDGTNMSFNYGNNGWFGAVGHWGGPDLGWVDNAGATGSPTESEWHHLVYVYDGEFTQVYADGELSNEEDTISLGGLNTHADTPIAIASQWDNASTLTVVLRGSLFINRVRVHDGALTEAQILANYNEEKGFFTQDPATPTARFG